MIYNKNNTQGVFTKNNQIDMRRIWTESQQRKNPWKAVKRNHDFKHADTEDFISLYQTNLILPPNVKNPGSNTSTNMQD